MKPFGVYCHYDYFYFLGKKEVKMAPAAANPTHDTSREPRLLHIEWRGGGMEGWKGGGVEGWKGGRNRLDYVERGPSNGTRARKSREWRGDSRAERTRVPHLAPGPSEL